MNQIDVGGAEQSRAADSMKFSFPPAAGVAVGDSWISPEDFTVRLTVLSFVSAEINCGYVAELIVS